MVARAITDAIFYRGYQIVNSYCGTCVAVGVTFYSYELAKEYIDELLDYK